MLFSVLLNASLGPGRSAKQHGSQVLSRSFYPLLILAAALSCKLLPCGISGQREDESGWRGALSPLLVWVGGGLGLVVP